MERRFRDARIVRRIVIAFYCFAPLAPAGAADVAVPWLEPLDKAVAAARGGDREKAVQDLSALLGQYPDVAAIPYNIALTYEYDDEGGRYAGNNLNLAAAFYKQALAVDPGFIPARYNLAVLWHRLGSDEEAATEYRLVVKKGGDRGRRAAYNLALLLRELGRPAEAAALLENDKASFEEASNVRLLALLAEDVGEEGKAIMLWKRALALDATAPFDAVGRRHLQALRGY